MLFLNVPYNEKDDVKYLGAKWNPDIKKWYVEEKEDYHKFLKWIMAQGNMVIIDSIYVVEGLHKCFKCGNYTRVIGFGIDNHFSTNSSPEDYDIYQEDIHIVGSINPIPKKLLTFLQKKYNYKERYSYTTNTNNISNCCDHCDILQGDFFIYNEVDSPFFIHSKDEVEKLIIYKIKLKNDLIVNCNDGEASFDYMFKKYGKIVELNIEI
ncbi:DUF5710 domain-containing protein [Peptoniphilaceae bacterium SGI.131]